MHMYIRRRRRFVGSARSRELVLAMVNKHMYNIIYNQLYIRPKSTLETNIMEIKSNTRQYDSDGGHKPSRQQQQNAREGNRTPRPRSRQCTSTTRWPSGLTARRQIRTRRRQSDSTAEAADTNRWHRHVPEAADTRAKRSQNMQDDADTCADRRRRMPKAADMRAD